MTIQAEKYDIQIKKGSTFYQEFQLVDDNMMPISLVGKTLKSRIKESDISTVVLHDLTEANGGMIDVNKAEGKFAMFIPANQTNISLDLGIYDIIAIDNLYSTEEVEPLIEGSVTYFKQITIGV